MLNNAGQAKLPVKFEGSHVALQQIPAVEHYHIHRSPEASWEIMTALTWLFNNFARLLSTSTSTWHDFRQIARNSYNSHLLVQQRRPIVEPRSKIRVVSAQRLLLDLNSTKIQTAGFFVFTLCSMKFTVMRKGSTKN